MNKKNREKEVADQIDAMWKNIETLGPREGETLIPVEEAKEERMILARKIGQMHLAYAKVLVRHLGEKEGKKLILEAIRDYSYRNVENRKKGIKDFPDRMTHDRMGFEEIEGEKRFRTYGCALAKEWLEQGEGALGALFCYVDPCTSILTNSSIKLYHTKMEPCGDECCEFQIVPASEQEVKDVEEKGKDYSYIDPLIMGCKNKE